MRFRGEDRIISRLEAGPVAVLNLMADRTTHEIDVVILGDGDERALDAAINIVYALEDGAVAIDESYPLAADAALRIDGGRADVEGRAGRVALAKISSRSAP